MMLCPCGSQKFYIACCGRYLDAGQIPSTPEALMRSRYTAYTQANIDYIQKTMRGKAAQNYNAEETRIWAQKADWQKLEVVKASDISSKSEEATVEFIAHFNWQGEPKVIHEVSLFKKIETIWYYVSGNLKDN